MPLRKFLAEAKKPSPAFVVACIALFLAVGPSVRAANTVFSTDIVDGEVKTEDVADNSLTSDDMKGANNVVQITLAVGTIANGRCHDVSKIVPGARVGEFVAVLPLINYGEGLLFQGVRVAARNRVVVKICNFRGDSSPLIDLRVRIMTFS